VNPTAAKDLADSTAKDATAATPGSAISMILLVTGDGVIRRRRNRRLDPAATCLAVERVKEERLVGSVIAVIARVVGFVGIVAVTAMVGFAIAVKAGFVTVSVEMSVSLKLYVLPAYQISLQIAPTERKRLELQPRSQDSSASAAAATATADATTQSTANAAPLKPKPNPFGGASARDEDAIMRKIEEKQQQKEVERRAADAATKKARDEQKEVSLKQKAAPAAALNALAPSDEGSWRREGPRPATSNKTQQHAAARYNKQSRGADNNNRESFDRTAVKASFESVTKPAASKAVPATAAISPKKKFQEVKRANVFDVLLNNEGEEI
ncbi:hypothetical protein HK100_003646, partial [Physocladia obscura]